MADAVAIFTPGQRLAGPDGVPLVGGSAEFYSAGTDDPLTVYADSALTVSLGTIVYTDSAGYPVTAFGGSTKTLVFTGTAPYKVVLKDGSGVVYATHDNCVGAVVAGPGGGGGSGITQDQGDVRYTRNANALTAAGTILDVDILPFWDIAGSANKGLTFANLKTKLTTDFRADGRMMPVGTRMPFQQTTPPTGWTKETGAAYNDATLRFTTGTVATSGTASFNTVFASRTFTGTVGATTISTATMPSHEHFVVRSAVGAGLALTAANSVGVQDTTQATSVDYTLRGVAGEAQIGRSSPTGDGGSHAHSLTMNAANFDVKYVEMCIGIKA